MTTAHEAAPNGNTSNGNASNGNASNGNASNAEVVRVNGEKKAPDDIRSFGVVRSLAWAAMALTLALSIVVSLYLGSVADKSFIDKNHSFASLLADNLNNQIYRRFTLPTLSIFGRIDLNNPEQYKALDQIIQSLIQGLNVNDLRIFSYNHIVRYTVNKEEIGQKGLASLSVISAATADGPIFDILSKAPYWQMFFSFSIPPETYIMRTTYPLRIENRLGSASADGPLMGVLEFSQDITRDIKNAIRFQQLVLAVTLLSSGMLMLLLMLLVRRAERALAARVTEKQRLQDELHQHERLAGMGRVVASIAHEIRNPLGIISSSAELLIRRAEGTSPGTSKILQAIYDEAKRLSRTVSDFLDYARPRQPEPKPVNITQIITQALAFLSTDMAERDIGVVRAGIIDAPLMVPGDKDLLYRAFYNIMSNAVQAMGAAGILTISCSRAETPESEIVVVFHDTGPGFPAEHMQQLLDPFFTTKDDGTGLGLPIMNNIITSHNGTLSLSNAPDGGAEVRVTLPALLQPNEAQ